MAKKRKPKVLWAIRKFRRGFGPKYIMDAYCIAKIRTWRTKRSATLFIAHECTPRVGRVYDIRVVKFVEVE